MKKIHTVFRICVLVLTICTASGVSGSSDQSWWHLFFTEPEKNIKKNQLSAPERAIITVIDSSKISIDGAFFDVGSLPVSAAFVRAYRRGVRVRIVTDTDYGDEKALIEIRKAGISVVYDGRKGLMHDKFMIVDSSIVWTGSYNITENCAFHNNNNAIMINSPDLAAIYTDEFNEMFDSKIFGNKKESKALSLLSNPYYVKIENTPINVYFSPDNDIERIIVKRIAKAKKSIFFMAFSFTSDPIGDAMIERFHNGVAVKGIFEKRGSNSRESEFIKMKTEGIEVIVDKNKYNMHHKVIIIDEQIVITGSFNFSKSANKKNDENLLIIDNSEIAEKYIAEFNKNYY